MININTETKTLLAVVSVLFIVYIIYSKYRTTKSEHFSPQDENSIQLPKNIEEQHIDTASIGSNASTVQSNEETLSQNSEETYGDYKAANRHYKGIPLPKEELIKYFPKKDYSPPEATYLEKKFDGRNKAKNGYKRASYSGSIRGNLGPSDWESYFDHNNNVVGNSQTGDNDKFLPVDESNAGFAVFKSQGRTTCGSNQNCEPEDLFDADKYLPQEVNDDWFSVQPEPISVKNRHLINITKPIGIDTIGTSLKNASWDLRGAPANPKYVVSPWLQSSIEPDTNLKQLY